MTPECPGCKFLAVAIVARMSGVGVEARFGVPVTLPRVKEGLPKLVTPEQGYKATGALMNIRTFGGEEVQTRAIMKCFVSVE